MPPSTRPRDRRAERRLGSHLRVYAALLAGRSETSSHATSAPRLRSSLIARAGTLERSARRRLRRVQGSDQANLLLRGRARRREAKTGLPTKRPLPLADPGSGVGRQLIPRGAQRLQGILQRFERARCAGVTARLSSCRVEGPRGFRDLGCPVVEELWSIHAADGRRPGRMRAWGSMPNCSRPSPHSNWAAVDTEIRPGRGECVRDPGCTYGPMAPRPPQLKDGAITPPNSVAAKAPPVGRTWMVGNDHRAPVIVAALDGSGPSRCTTALAAGLIKTWDGVWRVQTGSAHGYRC